MPPVPSWWGDVFVFGHKALMAWSFPIVRFIGGVWWLCYFDVCYCQNFVD
jgi:hypothetical protein